MGGKGSGMDGRADVHDYGECEHNNYIATDDGGDNSGSALPVLAMEGGPMVDMVVVEEVVKHVPSCLRGWAAQLD